MNILIVEPYYAGSHAAWAEGFRHRSRHRVEILKLAGAHWKWRMHGGAVTLARRFAQLDFQPDLIVASDMLDVSTFQALTRSRTAAIPFAVYFHENQLSYPWSPTDGDVPAGRDRHYGFINYVSAMAADAVFFNSRYHMQSFFAELDLLLREFPDHNELGSVDELRKRSGVLPLGLELSRFDEHMGADVPPGDMEPLILWNHRWEYDKNPAEFFAGLYALAEDEVPFRVAILGESFRQHPREFDEVQSRLGERILHCGYVDSFAGYAGWLHAADVLPVTSRQDFFGVSVAEAIYCRCRPLLPRRLAYTELIPGPLHDQVFYDHGEFVERLRAIVGGTNTIIPGLKESVAQYDWTHMAPIYDDKMEDLRNVNRSERKRSIT